MKRNHDGAPQVWLDELDAVVAGDHVPSHHDDPLLAVAARVATTLAPLREVNVATDLHYKHLRWRLRANRIKVTHAPWRGRPLVSVLVAALLMLALGVGTANRATIIGRLGMATQAWHAATSLDQITGLSIASLSRPHTGLTPLPLLPTHLPQQVQAATYGVIADAVDPHVLTMFVADYRIGEDDLLLVEQPSYGPWSPTSASTVRIGTTVGAQFQDDAGRHALQWFQDGMLCQLTSRLEVRTLQGIAETVQRISNWNLILTL